MPPRALSRVLNALTPNRASERTARIRRDVESVPVWFHSIDLGNGVVTPGVKTGEYAAKERESLRLPDLRGKTVLDVGAWDGLYSFEAERRGAAHVVALDHYVWFIDLPAWNRYLTGCRASGVTPQPAEEVQEVWRPEEMPGKRGFDVAHAALESKVEARTGDFMELDPDDLGQFDVVFFLGVLYHLKNPFAALERLAVTTREVAIIESEAEVIPDMEDQPLCKFLEGDERMGDPTNWWSPNLSALLAMCRAAGFSRVEAVADPDEQGGEDVQRYRAIVHAWR